MLACIIFKCCALVDWENAWFAFLGGPTGLDTKGFGLKFLCHFSVIINSVTKILYPTVAFDSLANANKESDDQTIQYFSWPIGEIKEPKFMHKFGYYECRCKMQQKEGWWCAFWMQSPIIGSTMNTEFSGVEVDIMEQFAKDGTVQHINHWDGYGPQYKNSGVTETTLEETEDGYHTFGLHWTENFYRFYVDGKLTREISAPQYPISKREQFVIISTEAVGYRNSTWNMWDVMPDAVGDKWYVDYVRVFEEK